MLNQIHNFRRDAAASPETETQEDNIKLIRPTQTLPERKIRAAQEQNPQVQPIPMAYVK